ncbi:MAG: uroporphyrinogen-III synthase [Hyphomicrobiales bacterium]|nr:uroporphyrinogen-III synthase [Hyphomicrobiales bacterium]
MLITRPEPGAARTAKRLEALGFDPARLPLTEIRPTCTQLPGEGDFDAVAIPSANAIRHAQPSLLRAVAGLPVFAGGRRTAEAAAEAGLDDPTIGPGDGQGLATLMASRLARDARVVYLCGRVRTRGFEETLRAAGIEATPVETYDTTVLDHTDEKLAGTLGSEAFDAVLLYSRVAAQALAKLTDRSVISPLLGRAAFICMSRRVAEPLYPFDGACIRIAAAPDEEAMLARLAA